MCVTVDLRQGYGRAEGSLGSEGPLVLYNGFLPCYITSRIGSRSRNHPVRKYFGRSIRTAVCRKQKDCAMVEETKIQVRDAPISRRFLYMMLHNEHIWPIWQNHSDNSTAIIRYLFSYPQPVFFGLVTNNSRLIWGLTCCLNTNATRLQITF